MKILGLVMAGGEGTRLYPLTSPRAKPSVPFGGRYRIIDFVLSNLINSGISSVYLLVQYKSQSLIEHVRKAWVLSPIVPSQFVTVVPPQMRERPDWFGGTADAVHQNLNLIARHDPDLVAVFSADHIYRMDVRQMVRYHQKCDAEVSVAAVPVAVEQASAFGIVAADERGRVREFQEKPAKPKPLPDDTRLAYASMGNYIFNTDVLVEALESTPSAQGADFGKDVLPALIDKVRFYAYDFATNKVRGVKSYEEPAYWRDIGTIEAYFAANHDLLGPQPRFEVFNPRWPIYSSNYPGPSAKVIGGQLEDAIVGGGTVVNGATVRRSVIRREVVLEQDAVVEDSIIMDYVRIKRGTRLRRVIIDRYNTLEAGTEIGYDPEQDKARFHVTPTGIVVVPRGPAGQFARTPDHGYF